VTATGTGVPNAFVTLIDQNSGASFTTRTNGFGYFTLTNVVAGGTYTVTVASKLYSFAPQTVTIIDAYNNLNLTALP
jgi:hypothetical protein